MLEFNWRHAPPPRAQSRELTARQSQVLRLAAEGLANKQIARELGISIWTVKNHFRVIFCRLNVETRTQAVLEAWKRGWMR